METMRICVIGNSHLAALKLAWDRIAGEYPEVEATFFGSPGKTLIEGLNLSGRTLTATTPEVTNAFKLTSGGKTAIHADEYDVFVIHGNGFSLPNAVGHANAAFNKQKTTTPATGGTRFTKRGISSFLHRAASALMQVRHKPKPSVSDEDVFAAIDVSGAIRNSVAYRLYAILSDFGKPIVLSPQPYLSAGVLQSPDAKQRLTWGSLLDPNGEPTAKARGILKAWFKAQSGLVVVSQPVESVIHGLFTEPAYSVGSVRLSAGFDTKHPETDFSHMNESYGMLLWPKLMEACREVLMPHDEAKLAASENTTAMLPTYPAKGVHPYKLLPDSAFWRRTVSRHEPLQISSWYQKKFDITASKIATAGSCFAQHIGRHMRRNGFTFLDMEPPPLGMSADRCAANGYGVYSARYGNVYTARQLLQLFERAFGEFQPGEIAWETEGGFVDPFRPTISEHPCATVEEIAREQNKHFSCVRELFQTADLFVFTLGLTEAWVSTVDGAVFPIAPGVSGGIYDSSRYKFVNFDYHEVLSDMKTFISKVRKVNPGMRIMLTVSPVPLVATASGQQVVVATTYSKSVLRAVAGQLATMYDHIDYFPSFEIISSHVMGGIFYGDDKRTVKEEGVEHVMKVFFEQHQPTDGFAAIDGHLSDEDDVVCDEILLDAFADNHGN